MKRSSLQRFLSATLLFSAAAHLYGCGGGNGSGVVVATPTPQPTVVSTATPQPGATSTPIPEPTPRATPTAIPTSTPTPGTALLPGPLPTDRSATLFYIRGVGEDYISGGNGETRLFKPPEFNFNVSLGSTLSGQIRAIRMYLVNPKSPVSFWSLDFSAPGVQSLKVGTYRGAMRDAFKDAAKPGLDISGEGRGCNNLTGNFTVRQLSTDASGNVKQFVADFEQACEAPSVGSNNKLIGTVRYNSDLNFR